MSEGIPGFVDADGIALEGIRCHSCGRDLNLRLVASSYPLPGGHYRRRVCRCGEEVYTTEVVVRRPPLRHAFIVWGFPEPRPGGPGGKSGIGTPPVLIAQLVRALGGRITRFR